MPHRLWGLRSLLLVFVLAIPLAHAQITYQFNLPEQALADTLRAIAAKTGTNILFDAEEVRGIKAAALHAELTTDSAIKHVLAGTRLEAEGTTSTTVIIRMAATL